MNSTVKSGHLKELEFGSTSPCVSRRGEGVDYSSKVNWLTLVENIVCNKTNFKLYPVSDW